MLSGSERPWHPDSVKAVGRACGLPSNVGAFVGRHSDLDAVCRMLEQARLVTLVGPPGVGKSRLGTELAHLLIRGGRDVTWVDLDGVLSVEDLCRRVSVGLGVPLTGTSVDDAANRVAAALAGRSETVTFLDHVERLQPEALALLERWLSSAPEAQLVAASRRRLDVDGEQVHVLAPLDVASAVALLVELAGVERPGSDSLPRLTRICERVDCLPLALQFAAARLRIMPPEELERRLSDRWKVLRATRVAARPPHRTLEDAIRWSWEDLSLGAQTALAQLPVFRTAFTLNDAEAVVELGADGPESVLEAFQELCDRCLVQSVADGRFRLLASVAEFAEAQASHDADALAVRYVDQILARLASMNDQTDATELSEIEPDLVAIHAIALAREDQGRAALITAIALSDLAAEQGPMEFGARALLDALSHPGASFEPLDRARAAARLGHLRFRQGRFTEADRCLEDAATGADVETQARIALSRSMVEYTRGDRSLALSEAERSAELARVADCPWIESTALFGAAAMQSPAKAAALAARAVVVGRRASRSYLTRVYLNAAGAALWRGAHGEVEEWLAAFDDVVDPTHMHCLGGQAAVFKGLVKHAQGRPEEALTLFDHAWAMFSYAGAGDLCGEVHGARGHVYLLLGDCRRAEGEMDAALELLTGPRSPWPVVLPRVLRAWCLARRGDFRGAANELDGVEHSSSVLETDDQWVEEATVAVGRGLVAIERALAPVDEGGARDPSPLLDEARQRLAWATDPPSESMRFRDPQLRQLVVELRQAIDSSAGRVSAEPRVVLTVGPGGTWFEFDGEPRVDLSRRAPIRRLLTALVEHTTSGTAVLSVNTLFEAGWPGQRAQPTSAADRVYWGIKTLRNLGLRPWLTRDKDGYRLEPSLTIRDST